MDMGMDQQLVHDVGYRATPLCRLLTCTKQLIHARNAVERAPRAPRLRATRRPRRLRIARCAAVHLALQLDYGQCSYLSKGPSV